MSDLLQHQLWWEAYNPPAAPTVEKLRSQLSEEATQIGVEQARRIEELSVPVTDLEYSIISQAIAGADDPEAEKFKYAAALRYSREFNLPLEHAYNNLEALHTYWLGKAAAPRSDFMAVVDSFKAGRISMELGRVAGRWQDTGGTDVELQRRADELVSQLEKLSDSMPHPWHITALKYGAQSFPFTIGPMIAPIAGGALIGGPLGAAIGVAIAGIQSFDIMRGLQYYQLRKSGVRHDIASPIAHLSGLVQAAVEMGLGNIPAVAAAVGKGMIPTITGAVVKRLALSGKLGVLARGLTRYAGQALEEASEEAIQELMQAGSQYLASELQGYGVEVPTSEQIADQVWESAKGGFLASLTMGIPGTVLGLGADRRQAQILTGMARETDRETFLSQAKMLDLEMFRGLSPEKVEETLGIIWEVQNRPAPVKAPVAPAVSVPVEEEVPPMKEAPPTEEVLAVYRTPQQRLYGEVITIRQTREGKKEILKIGDPESRKRYGYISYESTSEGIEIDQVVAEKAIEKRDMILELAARNPGIAIEWNPVTEEEIDLRHDLISNNPRGEQFGLQWFAEVEAEPKELTRDVFVRKMSKAFNAPIEQAEYYGWLADRFAKNQGIDTDEWLQRYIAPEVTERTPEIETALTTKHGVAGTMFRTEAGEYVPPMKVDGREQIKAVFVALEKADFHHGVHEFFHAVERLALSPEQVKFFEKALGELREKWTEEHIEKLANLFEDYLATGEAPTEGLRQVFEQIARILRNLISFIEERKGPIKLSPEYKKAYDALFQRPESGVAQAEKSTLFIDQLVEAEPPPAATVEAALVEEITAPEVTVPDPGATVTLFDPDRIPVVELPVADIVLSEEVPNFKEGVDRRGVIERLEGEGYERLGTAPIVVWERFSGRLEVITGRHRLDLAQRTGEQTIPAQVVREADGFTAAQAMTFDAESNIRDGQGSVRDYANYFRNTDITEEQASGRGLLARDKGRKGFAIGKYASDGLYALYRNHKIAEAKAAAIAAVAQDDERLQDLGILKAKELNAEELSNYVTILKTTAPNTAAKQVDLFGKDESFMIEAAAIAKEAVAKMNELRTEFRALSSALRLSTGRQAKIIAEYGFTSGDVGAVEARVTELQEEILAWTNWTTDPAKHQELRKRAGLLPGLPIPPMTMHPDDDFVLTGEPEYIPDRRKVVQQGFEFAERVEINLADYEKTPKGWIRKADGKLVKKSLALKLTRIKDESDNLLLFHRAPPVGSPEFRRWFGESTVVDEKGNPLEVYHGTRFGGFTKFRRGDLGMHFGTINQASKILGNLLSEDLRIGSPGIYPVYLRLQNPVRLRDLGSWGAELVWPQLADMGIVPRYHLHRTISAEEYKRRYSYWGKIVKPETKWLVVTRDGHIWGQYENLSNAEGGKVQAYNQDLRAMSPSELIRILRERGYDGIVYLNRREGIKWQPGEDVLDTNDLTDEEFFERHPEAEDSWMAFDPNQVKSVFNKGSWSMLQASILFHQEIDGEDLAEHERAINVLEANIAAEEAKPPEEKILYQQFRARQINNQKKLLKVLKDPRSKQRGLLFIKEVEDQLTRWKIIFPSTRSGARWQLSYWDYYGPFSHELFNSRVNAIREAISDDFEIAEVQEIPVRTVQEGKFLRGGIDEDSGKAYDKMLFHIDGEPVLDSENVVRAIRESEWWERFYKRYRRGEISTKDLPMPEDHLPLGMWMIDDQWDGPYGRLMSQLREVPIEKLIPSEETDPTKYEHLRQYKLWAEENKIPPPITVLELEDGSLKISDGHRRWLAAKETGKDTIRAWVNPPMATGKLTPEGKPIYVGLTDRGLLARGEASEILFHPEDWVGRYLYGTELSQQAYEGYIERAKNYESAAEFQEALTLEAGPRIEGDISAEQAQEFFQEIWDKAHQEVAVKESVEDKIPTPELPEEPEYDYGEKIRTAREMEGEEAKKAERGELDEKEVERISEVAEGEGKEAERQSRKAEKEAESALKDLSEEEQRIIKLGDQLEEAINDIEKMGPEPERPGKARVDLQAKIDSLRERFETALKNNLHLAETLLKEMMWTRAIITGEQTPGEAAVKAAGKNYQEAVRLGRELQKAIEEVKARGVALKAKEKLAQTKAKLYAQKRQAVEKYREKVRVSKQRQRAAKKYRELRKKLIRDIMRRPGRSISYRDYAEVIRQIQSSIDPVARRKSTLYRRKVLRQFIEENPEAAKYVDPKKLEAAYSVSVANLSLEQLEEIDGMINALRELGRLKRSQELEAERAFRETHREMLAAAVLRGKEIEKAIGRVRPTSKVLRTLLMTWKPDRIALMLDGGTPGVFTRWIVEEPNKAWAEKKKMVRARVNPVLAKMKELQLTPDRLDARRAVKGFSWLGEEVDIEGFRYSHGAYTGEMPTVNDVMFWYIGIQNEKTRQALVAGNNLPMDVMLKGIEKLTPNQKAFAEAIAGDFEKNFIRLREAFIDTFNMDLPGEDHYVPMRRLDRSYETRSEEIAADLTYRTGLRKEFIARNPTYARIEIADEHQKPISTNMLGLWFEGVSLQEGFIAQDRMIKRMHSILESDTVRDAVTQRYGPELNKWISRYINDLARDDIYSAKTAGEKTAQAFRSHLVISYLAFNLLTSGKQAASLALFMADSGPGRLLAATGQWMAAKSAAVASGRLKGNKLLDFVEERSELIKNRQINREFEELKRLDGKLYNQIIKKVGHLGMLGIQWVDKATITIGWKAVYDHVLAKTSIEAKAIQAADKAVARTQPSGRVQDLAEIYRSGQALTFFTMFTNALNAYWNVLSFDVPMALRQGQVLHAMTDFTAIAISGAMIALISGALVGGDDEKKRKEIAKGILKQYTATIPIIGSLITSALEGYSRGFEIYPAVGKAFTAVRAASREEYGKAVAAAAESLAFASGLPVTGFKRILTAAQKQHLGALLGWKEE